MSPSALVQKLWNYCNILRDDGLPYSDYVEQLTYLLFLKMAAEGLRARHHSGCAGPGVERAMAATNARRSAGPVRAAWCTRVRSSRP